MSVSLGNRSLFPHLQPRVYANHAAVSPPSSRVVAAANKVLLEYAETGLGAIFPWMEQRTHLKTLLGQLLHVAPECLALSSSTNRALTDLAHCLPWREGEQVTFGKGFLDGGSRVHFAMRDNDESWVQHFQAQALVELEGGSDGTPNLPNLTATPAPFIAWRTKAKSWDTVVRQAIAVCERIEGGIRLPQHPVTGQPRDEMDLWYLQQLSCPPVMLSPRALEEWHAARATDAAMADALETAATVTTSKG